MDDLLFGKVREDVDKCLNLVQGSATKDGGAVAAQLFNALPVAKCFTTSFDAH